MKHIILIFLFIWVSVLVYGQRENTHFSYVTTLGTGIAVSSPSKIPFNWQISGFYNIGQRFAIGAGTGVSVYEKILIPLFGDAKFRLTRPLRFTPYVECAAGYSFACDKNVVGGFYFFPSVGTEFSICPKMKLLVAAGYEKQKLERLKRYQDHYIVSEFQEKLNHGTISFRIGVVF